MGGGFAGCCCALALAEQGADVVIYERESQLLSRAAIANEGKLHLGFVYAGDRSLATARTMLSGAFSFVPILTRLLGCAPPLNVSDPFFYLVHRDSQVRVDEFARHLATVMSLMESQQGYPAELFAPEPVRCANVDPAEVIGQFRTPEVAVDPLTIASALAERVADEPRITVRLNTSVTGIGDNPPCVVSADSAATYDAVVNGSWESRIALDATAGQVPPRQWFHRFKYGLRMPSARSVPSTTIVLGPFGDTVRYSDGSLYASWYPAGMVETSLDLMPAYRATSPPEAEAAQISAESLEGLAGIVPGVAHLSGPSTVRGGVIVAYAKTDIDDPGSGLHARCDIGASRQGGIVSLEPGKYTTSPMFALEAARLAMA